MSDRKNEGDGLEPVEDGGDRLDDNRPHDNERNQRFERRRRAEDAVGQLPHLEGVVHRLDASGRMAANTRYTTFAIVAKRMAVSGTVSIVKTAFSLSMISAHAVGHLLLKGAAFADGHIGLD